LQHDRIWHDVDADHELELELRRRRIRFDRGFDLRVDQRRNVVDWHGLAAVDHGNKLELHPKWRNHSARLN
jgi:hypothetical protein